MAKFKYSHFYTTIVIKRVNKIIKKYFVCIECWNKIEFINKLIDTFLDKTDKINKRQFEKYLIENNYNFTPIK